MMQKAMQVTANRRQWYFSMLYTLVLTGECVCNHWAVCRHTVLGFDGLAVDQAWVSELLRVVGVDLTYATASLPVRYTLCAIWQSLQGGVRSAMVWVAVGERHSRSAERSQSFMRFTAQS